MQAATAILEWIGLGLLAVSAAFAAVAYLHRGTAMAGAPARPADGSGDPVFLFDGNRLVDASPAAHALMPDLAERLPAGDDWADVTEGLADRFAGIVAPDEGETDIVIRARDPLDRTELLVERIDGMTRLHLRPSPGEAPESAACPLQLRAAEGELARLRSAMDHAPYPIWRIDDAGEVNWCNAAYVELYRRIRGDAPRPGDRLFQSSLDEKPSGSRVRSSITAPGSDEVIWFDVFITRHDGFRMFYAVDVGAVVNAETAQRNFVQTLAKTFAQLSIGLAIFDRNRQLALFNPALIDLTALPAEFLSARPTLLSFFDRLRDARVMPEPRDYSSWREEMADLVEAAADGRYADTWSLPSGSIYRVTGRPHPDGAVAFLFEDITAEVTLTRRFRSDLEQSQSILDHLDEAIAVFAPNGVLSLTNAAFRRMWSVDPDSSFAEVTVLDAMRDWQARCAPSPVWGELRDFVGQSENRTSWQAAVRMASGTELACTVHPIQGGATMVGFREQQQPPAGLPAPDRVAAGSS